MSKGTVMKVFPGGNTSRGFYSLYNYIIPQDATRIFVIKGGPGVGKSTFMKKICESMLNRGYDAEWHCCSSDNGSIDGVVFPELGIALIDGTAPHIVDPKNPGAVDEIIHLGDYWNETMMRSVKDEVLADNRRVGRLFNMGYFALQEAMVAMLEWKSYCSEAQDWPKVNELFARVWDEVMGTVKAQWDVAPVDRHLYAWAVTPKGKANFIDTIVAGIPSLYLVEGDPGTGKSTFMLNFGRKALEFGYDVEFYHSTLNPEDVDGIVIRKLGVAIFSAGGPFAYEPGDYTGIVKRLNLAPFLKQAILNTYREEIRDAETRFNGHVARAVARIAQAKATHDHMEMYYVPAMDFAAIEKRRLEIEGRILGYAEELVKAAATEENNSSV